jgi:Extensin-like protein C-terminus
VARELRETVLHSACARFPTVLGPGSDWYHEDHIHLDLMERRGNYRICQWDVWDQLPLVAPLLPAERPEEAPPREVAEKSDAKAEGAAEGKPQSTKPEQAKPQATKKRR